MTNSKRPRTSEAGFSLIEGLVAAALLLIVTVGILPLFSRAMQNNAKGNDSTRQSNGAVDELERSISMPFNSGPMDIVNGATQNVETRVIALKNPPETISSLGAAGGSGRQRCSGDHTPAHSPPVQLRRLHGQSELRFASLR
ncbi:MAG: hypothetical protein R2862_06270 [Thermoanaerobaculia bacterium]